MLSHPTLERLHALQLRGMARAFAEQMQMPECAELSFAERLGLLVDREAADRESRRLARRLKEAKLRQEAAIEDLDFRIPRGLDKRLVLSLAGCGWIDQHLNVLITGPTGVGKSYLACALAHKACRDGYTVLYHRLPRLLGELALARGDGRYPQLLARLGKARLLVLDDWGLEPLTDTHRRDLLEILEDRYDRRSTLVTSQLAVQHWHDALGDPTLADAILDRLVHNAHRIALDGESIRKRRAVQSKGQTPT
ncbi:MAG TPA: IS21-like element helper ATPase IstB [Methylomirabilota bacterium]|nr:IS21-like element helper ATPase IstB [Methylomirabilota bacterium]